MKRLFKGLLLLGFIFLPLVIFAQTTGTQPSASTSFSPMGQNTSQTLTSAVQADTTAIFNLPVTDPSLNFLGQLFGTVGPVLHGTSGQLLGTLFQYFNLGILVVAGIFLLWTTVKVLIHSSQEGSFMGREVNAGFHIIRTVLGIGLLAPSAAGYSIIQIIVMWAVLQGAGFANTAWDAALDYFQQGGSVLVPPSTNIVPFLDMAGTVLEANLCMYYHELLEKNLQTDAKAQITAGNNAPIFTARAANFPSFGPSTNQAAMTINFPANRGNNPNDAGCGQFYWGQPVPPSNSALPIGTQQSNNNAYVAQALTQVIASTGTVARQMVYTPSSFTTQVANPGGGGGTITQMESMVQLAVVGAAQDWVNLTGPIRASASKSNVLDTFYDQARKDGWLYAGAYYYQLANVQRSVTAMSNVTFTVKQNPTCFAPPQGYMNFPGIGLTDCAAINASFSSTATPMPSFETLYTKAATYVGNSKQLAAAIQSSNAGTPQAATVSMGGSSGTILDMLIGPLTGNIAHALNILQTPSDPILKVQMMGVGFIDVAVGSWISFAIGYFFISLLSSLMSSMSSIGFAIRDAIFFFVPLYMALLGVMLVQGMLCVVYVPLIPFIIYTFTAIGWLIHVIEAMVAAPLVALGVTHPEGQGLMGKGEQAIMLLLGVFLRPVCMVLGLLAGMLLSYIALQMLNYPFINVIANITQFATSASTLMGLETAIIGIYVVLVIQIVTQSYSLIFNVPDRVLRWLGQQVEASGAGAALQAAESHGKEVGGAGAKSMTMPGGGGGGGGGGGDDSGGGDETSGSSEGGGGGGGAEPIP